MTTDHAQMLDCLRKHRLPEGLCLGSKSGYMARHPKCQFIPNANIFTTEGKIWWGDLDLVVHGMALDSAAKELGQTLYVTPEHAGRFGAENRPFEQILASVVWHTGGKRLVAWDSFFASSGLTRTQFTDATGFPRRLYTTPTAPEVALQWEKRLNKFRAVSAKLSKAKKLAAWGKWWLRPRFQDKRLPIEICKAARAADDERVLRSLIPPRTVPVFADCQDLWRPVRKAYPWW